MFLQIYVYCLCGYCIILYTWFVLRDDNCVTCTLSLKLQLFQVSLQLMTLLKPSLRVGQEWSHLSTTSSTNLHASPPTDFTFHHAKMKEYVCSSEGQTFPLFFHMFMHVYVALSPSPATTLSVNYLQKNYSTNTPLCLLLFGFLLTISNWTFILTTSI